MANLQSLTINDTGFIKLPVGGTGTRPGSPQNYMTRFNSDTGLFEYYDTGWKTLSLTKTVTAFSYTGGAQTWTKPAGVTTVEAYIWGAGGGFGNPGSGVPGGVGGYTAGVIDVTSVSTLNIIVGGGGSSHDNYFNNGNGNGCGGGLSGIFQTWNTGDVLATHAASILVAGAGGAGGNAGGANGGGPGGGTTGGRDDASASSGNPGTQSAGGSLPNTGSGSCTAGTSCTGAELRGGVGCGGAQFAGRSGWPNEAFGGIWGAGAGGNGCNAGGGGGGYWGGSGGGGSPNGGSGAGGSGYIGGSAGVPVLVGVTTAASTTTHVRTPPPASTSPYYSSGIGEGGPNVSTNGSNGRIVLVYYS